MPARLRVHPLRSDAISPLPAIALECRRPAPRARRRCKPRNGSVLVASLRSDVPRRDPQAPDRRHEIHGGARPEVPPSQASGGGMVFRAPPLLFFYASPLQNHRRAPTGSPAFLARNRPGTLQQTATPWCLRAMILAGYRATAQLGAVGWFKRIATSLKFRPPRPRAVPSVLGLP